MSAGEASRIQTPTSAGYGGARPSIGSGLQSYPGVPGIGLQGPNASWVADDADWGAGSTTYDRNYSGAQHTQGFPSPNPAVRQNVPRMGVGAAPVPGVNPGVPGTRAAPGYGGAGDASSFLAAILGGGGRY
jgi:hypothetical protein